MVTAGAKNWRISLYECILRHLRLGPLQVYSLGFFSVLDDHRLAGPLLGCQLPTLDTNYSFMVSFKSFNVYTPHSDHETMTQCRFIAGPQSTTLVQH